MKTFDRLLMETENDHTQNSGGRKMKAKELILGLVALSVILFATSASAGVPQMINYQGVLTDTDGCPVDDGDYDMVFRIYNAATGGDSLWGESHSSVSVTQGNFNVSLGGSGNPIPSSIFLNGSLWLEVEVEEEKMTPRQQIASVGYAFGAGMVMFDYESPWTHLSEGSNTNLTHNLGGDPSKYVVFLYGKSSSGGYIHQRNYGTNYRLGWRGCEWGRLTSTSIRVWRGDSDDDLAPYDDWYYFKIRILKNQ